MELIECLNCKYYSSDEAILLNTEYSTRDYSVVFEEKLVEDKDATFFAERVFKIVKND